MKVNVNSLLNNQYINYKIKDNLAIFRYSRECQYDKIWTSETRMCRGLIVDINTGEIIARPWSKFFNLNEMEETKISNLPNEPFYVLEKLDGSLGIMYKNNDKYSIATMGSFESKQAIWATDWINKNLKLDNIIDGYTYLFEIIYPENRDCLVINYGPRAECVLIGVINNEYGREIDGKYLINIAKSINTTPAKIYTFNSISELASYTKSLPKDQEGFVVTFQSGLKVKIKGDEYCKIHKIISQMTPLSFWECWDISTKGISKDFLINIPEELREESESLAREINTLHIHYYFLIQSILLQVPDKSNIKNVALYCQDKYKQYTSPVIELYKGNEIKVWEWIHKKVRPTNNTIG